MNLNNATTTNTTTNTETYTVSNLIRKSIALNHAGIFCMKSNNAVEAINLFTAALKTHKELMTKKNIRCSSSRRRKRRRTTGIIDQYQPPSHHLVRSVSTSSLSPSSSSSSTTTIYSASVPDLSSISLRQQQRLTRSINVDDLFVSLPEQYLHHITSSCNLITYRDLIRVPPIEELPLALSFAWEEVEVEAEEEADHGMNDDDDDYNNPREEEEEESFLRYISTSYAFNLALAHHQRGYELSLLDDTSDDTRLSRQCNLNRAGRLYELTLNLEKKRSNAAILLRKDEQIQTTGEVGLHSSIITDPNSSSSKLNWFTPRIILACINNYAQVHLFLNDSI
jgi:hypothetical protein